MVLCAVYTRHMCWGFGYYYTVSGRVCQGKQLVPVDDIARVATEGGQPSEYHQPS